jgi:hypothetical protein
VAAGLGCLAVLSARQVQLAGSAACAGVGPAHLGAAHGVEDGGIAGGQLEVELVERQALHQVTLRLGLEACHRRVAQLAVCGEVAACNAVQSILAQLEKLCLCCHVARAAAKGRLLAPDVLARVR